MNIKTEKRAIIVIFCFLLIIPFILIASGDKEEEGAVTLVFWWWGEQEVEGMTGWIDETIDKFEAENPNIKVEATLQDFSAAGKFRLSYRTLVRLVGDNVSGTDSGSDRWQVTEDSMNCHLTHLSKILCHGEKGTKREYRRL